MKESYAYIRHFCLLALACIPLASAGCGPHWYYTVARAQEQAAQADKPLLVFYRDHLDAASSSTVERLSRPPLSTATQDMVHLSLVTEYEPNRRFVARYGVTFDPVLIVVHPDGTYHNYRGPFDDDSVLAFLESAQPPGKEPLDDEAAAKAPTAHHIEDSLTDYQEAVERARRQRQPLLILYKWWLDSDSNELSRRLMLPRVAAKREDMVTCVLDWDYRPNRRIMADFGVQRFPALVLILPGGRYRNMEGLAAPDRLIEFLSPEQEFTASGGGEDSSGPPILGDSTWYTDYERARLQAERRQLGLFIYYHSPYSQNASQADALLDTPAAQELLRSTVNCRLSWTEPQNRELMTEFNVFRAPAFVAVRPNGTFSVRVGKVSLDELRALKGFLEGE